MKIGFLERHYFNLRQRAGEILGKELFAKRWNPLEGSRGLEDFNWFNLECTKVVG